MLGSRLSLGVYDDQRIRGLGGEVALKDLLFQNWGCSLRCQEAGVFDDRALDVQAVFVLGSCILSILDYSELLG